MLDAVKEELLVLFSLDKHIAAKNEEIEELNTNKEEIDAMRVVYEKASLLAEQHLLREQQNQKKAQ